LALDATNHLYVNNYHRNVVKFNASPSFGTGTLFPLPAEDTEHHLPIGVAVDQTTGHVYVETAPISRSMTLRATRSKNRVSR
jgi:hypothetical protein